MRLVNFLGPSDEFVVSGSDDGNLFVWDKLSGKLRDILEGDGAVVNVIEGHPHLPLVAASGIDTTVKVCRFTNSPLDDESDHSIPVVCACTWAQKAFQTRPSGQYH